MELTLDTIEADRTPPPVQLWIGDQRLDEGSAGFFDHTDPTTGLVNARIPLAGPNEIDAAVEAASKAQDDWRRTPHAERRRLLNRLADLVEEHADEFARLGALDNGTPITTAGSFVPMSAEWIRYYAGWADKIHSDVTSTFAAGGEMGYTVSQPYGVVGIIITWNGPLISLAMKVPPALAAGNTVVVKPSELTPFTGTLFARLIEEAGFPPGVVNILPGDGASGAALVEHPKVAKVSFTGGPVTARKILTSCAQFMKPSVMELGGKSANLVFADADLDIACGLGTFMSIGALSGQGCALPTRMLVERPVYEEVLERVAMIAGAIPVGDPFNADTVSGPVVNESAMDRILGMMDRAQGDSRLLVGGGRHDGMTGSFSGGYFLQPTVFADVSPESELAKNEVFGPVLAITPFDTDEEAIRMANGTEYGLSGYVHTQNLKRALTLAEELVTGEVLINGAANLAVHRPFGGLGLSGFGKEGGRAGLEEFLRTKSVGIA